MASEEIAVAVVRAGLSGLACALHLEQQGLACALFEASDRVGGRVTTGELDGFLLDRGFQVLLSSYPEARKQLDLQAPGLRPFASSSLVRSCGDCLDTPSIQGALLSGRCTAQAVLSELGVAVG